MYMYIFVPLINLMRYFVIFVMFSIIKHNSYHVMVHDWNKNILSYLILSYLDNHRNESKTRTHRFSELPDDGD